MDVLAQLQALDQATLTPLVRQALGNDSLVPVDWQVAPYGGGAGQCVYRFAGRAQDQEQVVPWSLILKTARAPKGEVDPAASSYWKREMLAYQSGLLADLPAGLAAPRCFGVVELSTGEGWLWLEEITNAAAGRWPHERFTTVARHLGTFSAAYLTGRPLPADPWLSRKWFQGHVARFAAIAADLPNLLDHPLVRPAMPGDIPARVRQVIDERETLFDALEALPQTFCHLDAFPRNLFVRNEGERDVEIVAIDWEFAGVNALGAELAPLVGGSLLFDETDLATADELEQAVFTTYLSALHDAGWRGDQDLVRLGYTTALVLHYVFLLQAVVVGGALNEEWRQFTERELNRPYTAILERTAVFFEFLLARADEARLLLRST